MNSSSPVAPNLFIVGAPKCGTTSLYEYLRQHPQIFFPANERDFFRTKEPNFFCPELQIHEKLAIRNADEYLALYAGSEGATWRGDASTHYLLSESAAERIKAFRPDARILITLRPPLDMMRSYHNDVSRHHLEDIADFHEAVAASADRRKGLRIPPQTPIPRCLDYEEISQFAPQVERYLRVFGSDAVKVVLLEDMAAAPGPTFRQILEFLDVDSTFQPVFRVHNESPGHSTPERLITSVYTRPGLNRWARSLIPYSIRRGLLSMIRQLAPGAPTSDSRDALLRARCRPDVERLAGLIGRDLRHWL